METKIEKRMGPETHKSPPLVTSSRVFPISAQCYVTAWVGEEFVGKWTHAYLCLSSFLSTWNYHNIGSSAMHVTACLVVSSSLWPQTSLVAQTVKTPPVVWETWVWSLGWEDPLEENTATYPSILAWRIPIQESLAGYSPWECRVRHDWATTWLFYYLDCSPPGSSVHGIIPEWVAISSSRGSSWPRDWTCASCVSCMGRRILYHWATWEVTFKISYTPIKNIKFKKKCQETSLVVQWLGLRVPNAGGLGFHPWLGNLTPHATTKTWHSKINK